MRRRQIIFGLVLSIITVSGLFYFFIYEPRHRSNVVEADCSCSDLGDIGNRINEANAAIKEYGIMIGEMTALDAKNGKPAMYGTSLYKESDGRVRAAIEKASKKGANAVTGETTRNCRIIADGPTECLIKAVQAHEKSNAAKCDAIKDRLSTEKGMYVADSTYFRDTMTMVEFWRQEIDAYTAELKYLDKNQKLLRADNSCAGN
jgi:hypothetical protein